VAPKARSGKAHDELPRVQSTFWSSSNVDLKIDDPFDFVDYPRQPLTTVKGPHSTFISAELSKSAKLCHFANGVDERLIFSKSTQPWTGDCVDWEPAENNLPLVFGYFDERRRSHHVFCVHVEEIKIGSIDRVYHIRVSAMIDVGKGDGPQDFIDVERPVLMKFNPVAEILEVDIMNLPETGAIDMDELLGRFSFIAQALGDGRRLSN
jgi:hypothetical protein